MIDAPFLSRLFDDLFPLMRSISGPGLRQSLDIIARHMPLEIEQIPSGTRVFDWTVPPEWEFRSARLIGPDGNTVVDAARHTLHVVNYSEPVDRVFSLAELQPHLHSLPHLPDAIPYVTSYYHRTWGFCLPHRQREALPEGSYRAIIDAEFVAGGVPFGQCLLPGESTDEILLSSYLCHPSMANNELSGPLVLLGLHDRLRRWPRRRYSYRFLLNPETIGALCYLHRHGGEAGRRPVGGMVLTCLGGPAPGLTYKLSRNGRSVLDRVMSALAKGTLAPVSAPIELRYFEPRFGSDERQYNTPGFNWPVGQIARTPYGLYPGYHNSLDDREFMGIDRLTETIDAVEEALRLVELAPAFLNLSPYGEPQLSRRDLYPTLNSADTWHRTTNHTQDQRELLNNILFILSYSDGDHSMLEIAARMGCDLRDLAPAIEVLEREKLLRLTTSGAVP